MQKRFKFLAIGTLLIIIVGVSGCQSQSQAPIQSPNKVIQGGLTKLSGVTSYAYNVGIKGDLTGPEGQPPASVKLNLKLNGGLDVKDTKDPKFTLKVSGNVSADSDSGSGNAELRLDKSAIFLNLISLNGKGNMVIPDSFKTQFIGKWWKFPIPANVVDKFSQALPAGINSNNLTPEQKQIKALVAKTNFFKDLKFVGSEKVMQEDSYHYSGTLNKDAFIKFTEQSAKIQGQTPAQNELDSMKAALNKVNIAGDIYVGKTSGILNKVIVHITLIASDKTKPSGTITVTAEMGNFNIPITIQEPANAKSIPPEVLGGLLGGISGTKTSASVSKTSSLVNETPVSVSKTSVSVNKTPSSLKVK